MNHSFKIGETYENMNGPYTVLSVSPPKMTIRYEDGTQSVVDIVIQERIWNRIQDELDFARQEYERRTKINRPHIDFSGLTEDDFKDNVTGTKWRRKGGLAGLVSRQLSDLSTMKFTSTTISRLPQFFVHPPHLSMLHKTERVKLPKFAVRLSPEKLLYGFYIEKSDKEMDREWYWPRFLDLMSEVRWQDYLTRTLVEREMKWILRFEENITNSEGDLLSDEIVISSFSKDSQFPTFSDFVIYLQNLPEDKWCNLYIAKTMDKQEAIDLQTRVSGAISQTLNALLPLYARLTNHAGMDA